MYLVVCAALLLSAALTRMLPGARRSFDDDYEDGWDLTPRELSYLRRGRYGVVLTVLAELHGAGAVDFSGHRVQRLDPLRPGTTGFCDVDDRLAMAVYAGLNRTRSPRVLAALSTVRRACRPLRWELDDRALLPTRRRRFFATVLLAYAVGLVVATTVGQRGEGWGPVVTLAAAAIALWLALVPRRTIAGNRELRMHRQALARVIADGAQEPTYLGDLVAAYGLAAIRVLCAHYVPVGALAAPEPSYEPPVVAAPRPAPPVPARFVAPVRLLPTPERQLVGATTRLAA